MGKLTADQVATLIIIERSTASVSVVATLFLLGTFIFIKSFRTLSNTLIFYASFANLFANAAALIGGSALGSLSGGLCQFQGFLLEMFMQSDPMWSCAMAVNVYLVFFRRYDATRLRKLYWVYALICYGIPFIPAMFCLFYKTKAKGKMYGNATLWCWIDNDWAAIRIYSYYASIWISILVAIAIYIRVGFEIFQKRSQLKALHNNPYASGTFESMDPDFSPQQPPPFFGIRTTEVEVHSSPDPKSELTTPPPICTNKEKPFTPKDGYSITITSTLSPYFNTPLTPPTRFTKPSSRKATTPMDRIKYAYTKTALLFALSILITWVPASINRVYGLRYPQNPSFALNVGSAIVLPLQGFWNSVIYFTTSLGICRGVWGDWRERRGLRRGGEMVVDGVGEERRAGIAGWELGRRKGEGDSVLELSRGNGGRSGSERSLGESF